MTLHFPPGTVYGAEPRELTLDLGDTYQLHDASADLTGTMISATKPIAIFGGNECVNVPRGYAYCDHIVEQIPPPTTWGEQFVTVPLATRKGGDTFRFVAAEDDTEVSINGSVVATLDAGQVHEQIIEERTVVEHDPTNPRRAVLERVDIRWNDLRPIHDVGAALRAIR